MLLPLKTPLVHFLSANGPRQHAITGVEPLHEPVICLLGPFCAKLCELAA
jgi:hypothetical protein